MQEQEKDLFEGYEVKHWDYSPYLYKIFVAAAVANLLFIAVLAQTNVLTARGCESPFVGRVCQVLDTVYIGGKILGTDGEFVSKDYIKNEIEDADITYIDVSGVTPPLNYPEGYFALANPESFQAMNDPLLAGSDPMAGFMTTPTNPSVSGIPGIPSTPFITTNPSDFMNTPQVVPTPNNSAVQGKIPDKPFDFGDSNPIATTPSPVVSRKMPRNSGRNPIRGGAIKSPGKTPKLEGDDVTAENKEPKPAEPEKDPITSESVADVEINKKPFEDLGDFVNESLEKKEVDLNKPFFVVLEGTITADGKLDPKKSKFIKTEGDEKMREVARQAIEAVGNSGFLAYLKNSGVDKVTFTLVQDDKQINAIIVSDQKTPEKAKTSASGFNTLLSGLKFADANGFKKLDDNSKTLIENSKITSDGKNFVLNFMLPKQTAQEILTKTLKDRAEKRAVQQPKSSAETGGNSKTALAK